MEKSERSKTKDMVRELRRNGKAFIRKPMTLDKRKTGSGVTFGGEYVKVNRKPKHQRKSEGQT